MDFGVLLPTREVIIHGFNAEDILRMGEIAEEYGYNSIWVGDSLIAKPRLEPIVTLSALSMRVKKIKLGTAVLLPVLRHPLTLAHSLATLDIISSGRIILGVGIGGGRYTPELFIKEFGSVGIEFKERVRRMEEMIEILRKLWIEKSVKYHGKYYQLEDIPMDVKPIQKPCIPIWISCSVAESCLKRVAKMADGWIANIVKPEEYHNSWMKIQRFAKEVGRNDSLIHPANYIYLNIDSDRDRAYNEADAFLSNYYNTKFTREILERWGPFGTKEDIIKRIDSIIQAGAKTIILHFASFKPIEKLEIFTKDVLPSFKH